MGAAVLEHREEAQGLEGDLEQEGLVTERMELVGGKEVHGSLIRIFFKNNKYLIF